MAIIINEEDSERRQRIARFYARRELYRKHFHEMGMDNIFYYVRTIESYFQIRFNKKQFFDEVNNPSKCLIIEDL